MNADNSGFGPPPLATPITADGSDFGIPFQDRGTPRGDLHTAWGQWFNQLGERVQDALVVLRDTRAHRVNYPAANYPTGTTYQETDTGLTYIDRTTLGTVDTNVLVVNSVSGDQFTAALVGTQITINAANYVVAAFVSAVQITLATSAGVQAGVAYSSPVQQWEYFSGTQNGGYAALPVGLLANDVGLPFFDTTHWRLFVWVAVGGAPASTSPGWARGLGEVPTGQISILPFGPGTSPGMITGWSLCNGGGVSITQDDASTVAITKPNFAGGAFPKGGTAGTYGPTGVTPNAAAVPTIGGATDSAVTGITVTGAAAASAGTGQAETAVITPVDVLVPPFSGGGGGGAVTDGGHTHPLSAANAPITLPGDPVANVIVPFYMKR